MPGQVLIKTINKIKHVEGNSAIKMFSKNIQSETVKHLSFVRLGIAYCSLNALLRGLGRLLLSYSVVN